MHRLKDFRMHTTFYQLDGQWWASTWLRGGLIDSFCETIAGKQVPVNEAPRLSTISYEEWINSLGFNTGGWW